METIVCPNQEKYNIVKYWSLNILVCWSINKIQLFGNSYYLLLLFGVFIFLLLMSCLLWWSFAKVLYQPYRSQGSGESANSYAYFNPQWSRLKIRKSTPKIIQLRGWLKMAGHSDILDVELCFQNSNTKPNIVTKIVKGSHYKP